MTTDLKNITNFVSTCTITAIEGVDNPSNTESSTANTASITLGTNSAITINNGGKLVTGSLAVNGGSIAIQTGGEIKLNTPLYVTDADADGWATDFTLYTATGSGLRRLGLMRSVSSTDCGGGSYSANNQCCVVGTYYADTDGDGYGYGASSNICPTAGYVANNTDCNDTGTNSANVYISASCYTDVDNDNYGSATAKSCTNHATCGSATWASGADGTVAASGNFAAGSTDCYDYNANAYPSSTYCGTANRGDGTYDYNCNSSQTHCGSEYYSATSAQRYICVASNFNCIPKEGEYYGINSGSVSCGQAGYLNGNWQWIGLCAQTCEGSDWGAYLTGAAGTQGCR
jgi:hypothetical protein